MPQQGGALYLKSKYSLMAEAEVRSDFDGVPVETFTYSAGSYDRLKSNEGYFKTMAKTVA